LRARAPAAWPGAGESMSDAIVSGSAFLAARGRERSAMRS
jgi:hypothetical protein